MHVEEFKITQGSVGEIESVDTLTCETGYAPAPDTSICELSETTGDIGEYTPMAMFMCKRISVELVDGHNPEPKSSIESITEFEEALGKIPIKLRLSLSRLRRYNSSLPEKLIKRGLVLTEPIETGKRIGKGGGGCRVFETIGSGVLNNSVVKVCKSSDYIRHHGLHKESFDNQIATLMRLPPSDHIVPLLAVGIIDQADRGMRKAGFVIPKYKRPLSDFIKDRPSRPELLSVLQQIADGHAFALEHDVLLGDGHIKNIMLDDDDQAVIFDVGSAVLLPTTEVCHRWDSVEWAPEVRGQPFVHCEATEVYTFGTVIFEMLTGVSRDHTSVPRTSRSDLPDMSLIPGARKDLDQLAGLTELMSLCLEDDMVDRPTFREISDELRREFRKEKELQRDVLSE
eukprot:855629_1